MNTPEDPDPATLARALEERGYESLWIGEHSHIPVARRTPYPAGGETPSQYTRMMDPFVSLTAAGGATQHPRPAPRGARAPQPEPSARANNRPPPHAPPGRPGLCRRGG